MRSRPAAPDLLGDGEGGRQRRCRRMRQEAVDAVLGDRELGVVVIVGVDPHTVGESSEARRHLAPTTDHRRDAILQAEIVQMPANQFTAAGDCAREGQAETIEDRFLAECHELRRQIVGPGLDDELGDVPRQLDVNGAVLIHPVPLRSQPPARPKRQEACGVNCQLSTV